MTTMKPVPVADIEVPEELSRLRELAYNLWWSWNPKARRLFSDINPQLWDHYRNPVQLLINIEPHHWEGLLDSGSFMSDYRHVMKDFDEYMNPSQPTRFQQLYPDYNGGPVGYFSTEFGLHESLGIYCGGLGVLSGDHAKAASDMGLPFIGIGILYRKGYFRQAIDPDGRQHHIFNDFDFYRLPLRPLQDETGRDLVVSVDFPDREVHARVWQLNVGRVKLYLLDADILENEAADRPITSQLYVRGREMRLCQELVLGVGGVRALRQLKIEPASWHMNEGHSAFLTIERMREETKTGKSWDEALNYIKENTLFTTHTPVPAGNEAFDVHLVEKYMKHWAGKIGVDLSKIMDLGKSYPEGGGQPFNLTALAIRFSSYQNGVSKLHGDVSCQMWHHLFPGKSATDKPIDHVTNGIHVATWLGHDIRTLVEENMSRDWQNRLSDKEYWKGYLKIDNNSVWEAHQNQKQRLIRFARKRLMNQFARHGNSPDAMREVGQSFDKDTLMIGFARRFATYKRAGLIFKDYDRLSKIITDSKRPVHLVFSGKAHPADIPGQELVKSIVDKAFYSDLKGYIHFIEDYDMQVGRLLVQGVDVWLNTPRRPREASGTSGMKAAMNGAPNLSISDGWWAEGYNGKNGWLISDGREYDNEEMQDYEDSASFYDILENQLVPLYYDNRDGWVEMMKESTASNTPVFSAARMLDDYGSQGYVPLGSKQLVGA